MLGACQHASLRRKFSFLPFQLRASGSGRNVELSKDQQHGRVPRSSIMRVTKEGNGIALFPGYVILISIIYTAGRMSLLLL